MADSRRPAVQLFEQLFGEEKQSRDAGLESLRQYLEEGGSIFPLVEKGVQGLVLEHTLGAEDARQILRRLNSMATYVRRQFIQRTLSGDKGAQAARSSGILAMVDGPSYERLFPTSFDSLCPPDGLESITSPVAYLIDLLRWIRDRIELYGVETEKFPLHDRRKDLKRLSVDFNAVYRSVSSVDIIVAVLETFISEHQPGVPLEDALLAARYPNGLPYYQHWVTIDTVARHHGLSVGDFSRRVDLIYPYFLSPLPGDTDAARAAMIHTSRLGPRQREVLTEPAAVVGERNDFYRDNYGADVLDWQNLNQVTFFGGRTKLDTRAIESLLSVRTFAPVRSANVKFTPEVPPNEAESGHSGSIYINKNQHPAIGLTEDSSAPSILHKLTANPSDAAGLNGYDRMNRMVRLANWLELPFDQVDALLAAAMRAESRGTETANNWEITEGVVRALGLYQSLRERYQCTPADFAVFIDELAVYGRAEVLSPFDQVFNHQGDYRQPFKLDGATFPLMPLPGVSDLTISQLCEGLAIDLQTYHYLALAVASAHGLSQNLTRTAAIVSSFYRLVKLPRLLNITPMEGLLMLTLLGGEHEQWLPAFAGEPAIHAPNSGTPDVLNLIEAMSSCVQWCEDSGLSVSWMLQHVAPAQPVSEASESDRQFFEQIRNLLSTALLSNGALLMAGVPSAGAANWLDFLTSHADNLDPVVDADGLVLAPVGTADAYLSFLRAKLAWAVESALGDIGTPQRDSIVETMLSVVLQARDAQVSLVRETLAVYAGVPVDRSIALLDWSNATVYQLLRQVIEHVGLDVQETLRGRNEEPDPLLTLLGEVRRRAEVTTTLGLSATLLQDYLDYGHLAWLNQADKYAFTVRTLYYLTTLTRAFSLSEQPEQALLDYLRQVNALPKVTGHAARLAQQAAAIKLAGFFGWSVQEVNECVSRVDESELKVLKDLTQLDLLMRVRVLSADSGMDALTIFLMGRLPATLDKAAYAEAAELALLSETRARVPVIQAQGDLKQLVTITCNVDNSTVVANKSDSKATYTVTLTDAEGQALKDVTVYWRATLGTVETKKTEVNGVLQTDFVPGKVMGTDTPQYWLDLFEPENAPPIQVMVDFKTLSFSERDKSPVPLETVPRGQEVELYARLRDNYGNLGQNLLVDWSYRPVNSNKRQSVSIRPAHGFTNQEGLTRVFVSSATGGTFTFSVLSQTGETSANFEAITFEGDEEPA